MLGNFSNLHPRLLTAGLWIVTSLFVDEQRTSILKQSAYLYQCLPFVSKSDI